MENYFSKHYASLNNINSDSEQTILSWFDDRLKYYDKEFLPFAGDLKYKKILELGCGIGGFLFYLKKKGIEKFIGVDNSEDQLSICRQYVTDNIIHADVFDFLQKNKENFDLIVLYDLIEHIKKEKILDFVYLLFSSLADRGKVIVRTPNMGSISGLYSRYIDFTHEVGFTEESLQQVFIQYGFKKIDISNSYIGKKRLYVIKTIQVIIEKIYNIKFSKIVTRNMMLVAEK